MYSHVYMAKHTHTYMCTYIYTHTHIHVHAHTHTHTHTHVCTHILMNVDKSHVTSNCLITTTCIMRLRTMPILLNRLYTV